MFDMHVSETPSKTLNVHSSKLLPPLVTVRSFTLGARIPLSCAPNASGALLATKTNFPASRPSHRLTTSSEREVGGNKPINQPRMTTRTNNPDNLDDNPNGFSRSPEPDNPNGLITNNPNNRLKARLEPPLHLVSPYWLFTTFNLSLFPLPLSSSSLNPISPFDLRLLPHGHP